MTNHIGVTSFNHTWEHLGATQWMIKLTQFADTM